MKLSPMRVVWGVAALLIAVPAVLSLKPNVLSWTADLALKFPGAQFVALRGWEALGLAAIAIFFLVVGLVRRFIMRRGRIALSLALVLAICAGAHGITLVSRGITDIQQLSSDYGITEEGTGDGSITVMQFNTQGGRVAVATLADVIQRNGVDVVSLVETSTTHGNALVEELSSRGLSFQIFHNNRSSRAADWGSSVVLVSSGMGTYAQQKIPEALEKKNVLAVAAGPTSGSAPSIVAVHAESPSTAGEVMNKWKQEIAAIYSMCERNTNTIIVGDFNSTVDHEAALGGPRCNDAMTQAGAGGLGTWPSNISPFLGSVIDRVLLPAGYQGAEGMVVEEGSTDHRGVVVRVKPE